MKIQLSSEARRKIGGTFQPRERHPDEAAPQENDLWRRPMLTAADLGKTPYIRPGADTRYPSRGPFARG